ncbi:MAG: ribosomal-processing cysteine protease Prp [Erysipelotrichaceae bacterium]|nr:ribosomal-processing cysteine protease Prp [Erysipelotrichaceae bacterium]
MIKAVVDIHNEDIINLNISGHANFAEYGNDIVCAGVSSIIFGLMNALDEKRVEIKMEDNEINIRIIEADNRLRNYLELCLIQLKTIEEVKSQNLKIVIRKE